MTQKFSLLALAATLALPAAAQQDPAAGKILDAVSAKYTALKSFQAGFTQTLENPAAKLKQNITGDVLVSGQKYHLTASGQEVINDGKTTWTYLKSENEVNIADSDPTNQDMSPSQMYTMYKKGYKYQLLKPVKEGGVTYDQIELSPENKTNDVFKVQILVSQADKSIKSVKTFKKNGSRTTFTLKNFKANVPVTATTFAFDKAAHPGVKVVDLR
ncbi:MAG: outer membrane lipoprotein carrier protein LolA [Hymenobacter sp.]|nr:MAG: outer membrane lipoprotein carrier protein LolA [Hymenobacter sp.]